MLIFHFQSHLEELNKDPYYRYLNLILAKQVAL